ASIPAQPHNRTVASNNVTLVYSTSSASSDNSTHISCVLYEAEVLGPNHRTYVWDMVSCREFHITARSNTGATRSANSDYIDNEDYTMFTIFDAVSKPPKTDYLNYMSDHYDMTRIAILSADLLKNLAERMYPFMADYTGIVQPWEYRSGISVEKWTVVFIGTLIGLMVVTAVVERFLVEDIWRADVLTLIENSTKEYTSKKQWKKHYPEWSVVQCQLRVEIVVINPAAPLINQAVDFDYPITSLLFAAVGDDNLRYFSLFQTSLTTIVALFTLPPLPTLLILSFNHPLRLSQVMTIYFLSTQFTGLIGIFTIILNLLYSFGLGLILNIIIQLLRGKNLRLRIAGTSSILSLLSEWKVANFTNGCNKISLILLSLTVLVVAGNAIPFIINTGMKASESSIIRLPTDFWKYGIKYECYFYRRLNSSDLLKEMFLEEEVGRKRKNSLFDADFSFLSETKPVAVIGANTNYNTALPIPNPPPGTVSLTRLLNIFSEDNTPTCDPTSPKCEITSMRTTFAPWTNPSFLSNISWKVIYNDHEGNPIIIANVSDSPGSRNVIDSHFVVERPTTVISGYTETNGISVMVAVTTASFQTQFDPDPEKGLNSFHHGAIFTIRSEEPLYTSIYNALKASIPAQPHNRTVASNNVTLVYSTSSASSDNSTHISCVLYEAEVLEPDQPTHVRDMVSCREFHITARSNTGATRSENSDYIDYGFYTMFTIFDSTSISQRVLGHSYNRVHLENVTEVAIQSADLLKNLTERMYPFMANYTGIVQPWEHRSGISVEKWTVVFIGTLIGLVVVTAVVERFLVEDIWRADVLTLIENSTKEYTSKKKQWEKRYGRWSVVQVDGSHQVKLWGKTIWLEAESESQSMIERSSTLTQEDEHITKIDNMCRVP
ncbi:hypothetical protein FBU30_010329, partial [Linnemannia zychae]